MSKELKLYKGNVIKITKRRCKPMHQPFFKVGTRWLVIEAFKDYVYVSNKSCKSGKTKLSLNFFDVEAMTISEVKKISREETVDALNKKMQETFNDDDHNVITFYPLVSQLICLKWANDTRWSAIQHKRPLQRWSRRIRGMKDEFDKIQRIDYKKYDEYDKMKQGILSWINDNAWEDKKMYQQALKVVKKKFPGDKYPDMTANAICTLLALKVNDIIEEDAGKRLAEKMPLLNTYQPLEMIHTTLSEIMYYYLPDEEFTIDSVTLKHEIDNLYKRLHTISFKII